MKYVLHKGATMTGRFFLSGHSYHVVRRLKKNESDPLDERDMRYCLDQIRLLKRQYEVLLYAWCILPYELHLLVSRERDAQHISSFMKALSCRISFHRKSRAVRHVWDARFDASLVESGQWTLTCMCYLERLPVLSGIVQSVNHYPMTSYRMRVGKAAGEWLDYPPEYMSLADDEHGRLELYRHYVRCGVDPKEAIFIRSATFRNRIIGSDYFVRAVYRKHGVLLVNRGPGRPRKSGPMRCDSSSTQEV